MESSKQGKDWVRFFWGGGGHPWCAEVPRPGVGAGAQP